MNLHLEPWFRVVKGKTPVFLCMSIFGQHCDPPDLAVFIQVYAIIRHQVLAIVGIQFVRCTFFLGMKCMLTDQPCIVARRLPKKTATSLEHQPACIPRARWRDAVQLVCFHINSGRRLVRLGTERDEIFKHLSFPASGSLLPELRIPYTIVSRDQVKIEDARPGNQTRTFTVVDSTRWNLFSSVAWDHAICLNKPACLPC